MLFSSFREKANGDKRDAQVGWLVQTPEAAFIWAAPRLVRRGDAPTRNAKSVTRCPAVIDHESRLFEIPCPFDLSLRYGMSENGDPALFDASGEQASINPAILSQVVALAPREQWRHSDRPILQILTPYRFLSDDPVFITQLPPFLQFRDPSWPGVFVGGRFPIHIWPRKLNWGFEWYDTKRDLTLTRGEPWFYIRFEGPEASRPVRLVEAELTPAVTEYLAGIDGVVKYVNRTFSLFQVARDRRPRKLLEPRQQR